MKYKVISFTILGYLLYLAFNFGVQKFIIWVADGDKKPVKKRKKKCKSNKQKNNKLLLADHIELKKQNDLLGLRVDCFKALVICLVIIIYAIVKLP